MFAIILGIVILGIIFSFLSRLQRPRQSGRHTCESCYFYGEYRTKDCLDPETRTIIPGELQFRVCGFNTHRGGETFELDDITACEKWKPDTRNYPYEKKTYVLKHILKTLSTPPRRKTAE